jgi:nucleoid-associated protein YgaU
MSVIAGYLYQMQLQKLYQQEQALETARHELDRLKAETSRKLADIVEKRKILTNDTIAIAGEYRLLALGNYRDVSQGEATLHKAKEQFALAKYDEAFDLARQAISELKSAPRKRLLYHVRTHDTLWSIAKKSPLRSGYKWVKIWHANKKKIRNPNVIYPRQILVIPVK